jgi:hypothetical protein
MPVAVRAEESDARQLEQAGRFNRPDGRFSDGSKISMSGPVQVFFCRICGFPGLDLCQQCLDWQPIAAAAEAAIEFSEQFTARDATRKAEPPPPAVGLLKGRMRGCSGSEVPR